MNTAVADSGGQQRVSAIHTHACILPETPLPARLLHNSEQSSLCWTPGPCSASAVSTALCTWRS